MSDFLLQLLGARPDDLTTVVDANLALQPAVRWPVAVLLLVAAVTVAIVSYHRRDVELSRRRRGVLVTLRVLALLGLVALLLRPELVLMVEGRVRQSLVLLFDQSASMNLVDPRTDAADQVRAAIADGRLPAAGGLQRAAPTPSPARPSRLDLLRAVVTNRELALLDRLGRTFELVPAGFSDDLVLLQTGPLPSNSPASARPASKDTSRQDTAIAEALRAEGRRTAMGTALRSVLDREQGRPLGGIILFTDGIQNAGTDPRAAAARMRDAGVALHVVALGTTHPRDIQVLDLTAPEAAFARDEVPTSVRLQARGLAGQTTRVTLNLDGKPVDARDLTFTSDGEQEIAFRFTPENPGDFELAVEVTPRPDEILTANNRRVQRLRVMDDRVRVLVLEQSPRWEFRYLQALLLRDRRVDLKCVLFDGEPAIARDPGSPYLDGFPARREDLFAYDLIVFGDVDPKNFTPAQLEILSEFVSRSGGSLLLLAGRRFSPWGFRDTALERMLPVEVGRPPLESPATALHDRPRALELTPDGRRSPLLQLSQDSDENLRRWQALPPVFWAAPVGPAKPAAQVLIHESTPGTPDGSGTPVMALQQYGVGEVLFLGTDNTWRWRRAAGDDFHASFWGRVVQRLAIHHLVSGSRRTQLLLDRPSATPGERVGITARLFTSAFEPLAEPEVRAELERDASATPERPNPIVLTLRAVPDQPGLYQGQFIAPEPGHYQLRVGTDAPAAVDLTVEEHLVEAGETAVQEDALRELASQTGGTLFREENLDRLPETVQSRAQRVRSRLTVDVWSSPFYFLAILLLLSAEWALRRWWHLK